MPPFTSTAGSAGRFGLFKPAATYSRPCWSCFRPSGPRPVPQSYSSLLRRVLDAAVLAQVEPPELAGSAELCRYYCRRRRGSGRPPETSTPLGRSTSRPMIRVTVPSGSMR